jgi:AraC-like DNA-binding protein
MIFLSYAPKGPLSELVESLWYWESDQPLSTTERVLPDGSMQLIIALESRVSCHSRGTDVDACPARHAPMLCGPYSEFCVIEPSQLSTTLGVNFKPGGASTLFRIPTVELHNRTVPLDAFWGHLAADISDHLLETRGVTNMFQVLEGYLLANVPGSSGPHPLVAHAVREFQVVPQGRTVAAVASQVGCSHSRFIDVFKNAVGLTPKVFCRVQRFQHALRLIRERRQVDWADIALSCGFFDQAHFIHDFRTFAGMSPADYFACRTEFQNHVPDRD